METVENRTRMREEVGPRKKKWGTWEELTLGGAILRHGIQDWNVVALELRSRNIYFTPQACKAKYEDLQKRYTGCNAWFEELRKRRVEELKRELEKSESSIGSLVTKIESLKAEKERSSQINYGSGTYTESPAAHVKSERMESIGKDGICAGNFMLDSTRTNFSPEFESPAVASANEIDSKLECSESCEAAEVPNISNQAETTNGNGRGALRKRKGKRKRKDIGSDVKRSIGESDKVCSISGISLSNGKETSTSCNQSIKPTTTEDNKEGLSRLMNDDLTAIFNSIIQNEAAMVFRHCCDSQKRAKYKEMIKQHMDIETVRSRLVSCSIKSPGELFRDLLLLATNAIVFYSKRTREHKSAVALRDIVTKVYHDHYKSSYHTTTSSLLTFSTTGIVGGDDHKPSDADSEARLQSLLAAKKGYKGHDKYVCGSVDGSVNPRYMT